MKHLIKLEKDKITINKDVKAFYDPDYIMIHSNGNYKINDYIYMGTRIGNSIASVSGKVFKIDNDILYIENDFHEDTKDKIKKRKIKNKDDLKEYIPDIKDINAIVVSAINDEPYVYNKIFLLKDKINLILENIDLLTKTLNLSNALVAIKNNESFIIDECLNVIGTYPNIKIALLPDEYLIGKEEYLLKKLNMSKNTLFLSIEDIVDFSNILNAYLETTKIITITFNNESTIIRVKIGTPLIMILKKYFKIPNNKLQYYINGLMTGYRVSNIDSIYINDEIESIYITKIFKV